MKLLKNTFFLVIIFLFIACNKYPDGPKFTLLTRTSRMAGKWDLKETLHSDGTITYDTESYTIELTKDGHAEANFGNIYLSGSWEFTNRDEKIKLIYGSNSYFFRIRRLKASQLWLEDENSGDISKYENVD